jgi:hypothetical protein
MRKSRAGTRADISLVCFLGLIMALMVFLSAQTANFAELNLIFCVQTVILLVTYFTGSLITGLALSGLTVLGYGGYNIYQSLSTGLPPPARLYFFILWMPLLTLAFWGFVSGTSRLSHANRNMCEALKTLGRVDEATGLPNIRAYAGIMPIYMGLARRYGLSLGVIAGKAMPSGSAKEVSLEDIREMIAAAEKSMRVEDEIFTISLGADYVYAVVLLMVKPDDGEVVLSRMKKLKAPEGVSLKLGYCPYSPKENMSPQLILKKALATVGEDF